MSEAVWEKAQPGHALAVVGQAVPPAPRPWRVVRIHCGGPRSALRPLQQALVRVDRTVGQSAVFERTSRRLQRGLRSYLLGEDDVRSLAEIVGALNRLADVEDRPTALVFDRVELADLDTLSSLRRISARPGWLLPALIVGFGAVPSTGLVAALYEAATEKISLPEETAASRPGLREMPYPARNALRAAAVIGEGFEVDLLAALLGMEPLRALEWLQAAQDAGAGLEDLGDGRFQMDPALATQLRTELMPSLAAGWNRRLARLLSPDPAHLHPPKGLAFAPAAQPPEVEERLDVPSFDEHEHEHDDAPDALASAAGPDTLDVEDVEVVGDAPMPSHAEVRREVVDVEPLSAGEGEQSEATVAPGTGEALESVLGRSAGPTRAAGHLREAGRLVEAAEAWLNAADNADPMALMQTVAQGEALLSMLAGTEDISNRDMLSLRLQLALGWLKLEGCTPDGCFTFDEALTDLERALSMAIALGTMVPIKLMARVRSGIAMACYDKGDEDSLERALSELTTASRDLMRADEPLAAAQLLNEQAAVWIRIGDPVRAAGLLRESRQLFARHGDRPESAIELAETYHLLARLPLHVPPRPGQAKEALDGAISHARDARAIYQRLGMLREVARVRETWGRLLIIQGQLERAAEHLNAALAHQQEIGDALGLARTTSALSELLLKARRPEESLKLLQASIQLNLAKGSARGLAYNRTALDRLVERIAPEQRTVAPIQRAQAQLQQAESRLGVISVAEA